jgi:hypothetical protein
MTIDPRILPRPAFIINETVNRLRGGKMETTYRGYVLRETPFGVAVLWGLRQVAVVGSMAEARRLVERRRC